MATVCAAACACGEVALVYAAVAFDVHDDARPRRRLVCPQCGCDGPSDEAASPAVAEHDAPSSALAWAALAAVATAGLAVIALA